MKVIIVGAGIGGLSLAWALARRKVQVSLFEQGPIPNPIASSFDEHRITRHTYGGLAGYGQLMPQAFSVYERLWQDLGRTHYLPTGMVIVSRDGPDWYGDTANELDAMGVAHRRLPLPELAARLPMLSPDGVTSAFEAGGSGMLFAGRIVADLARWVGEAGVDLHPHSRVTAVDAEAGWVQANGARHHADVIVVAAGAWLTALVPQLAKRLVPSRQLVLYLDPPASYAQAWANAPVIVDAGMGHGAYILPPRQGTRLKIGDHLFTRRGDGADDRIARPEDVAPVRAAAAAIFRDFADYRTLEEKVCYYTVTADERFVVEPLGSAGWVLSACSGHGFKLGPLIGTGLAEAITGARPAATLPAWAAGLSNPG